MPLYLIITSKNLLSLKKFIYFVNKSLNKNFQEFLFIKNFYKSSIKKTKITVLKSPHVNKKAKEAFSFYTYKIILILFSLNFKRDILFLKQLNRRLFLDLSLKIKSKIIKNNTEYNLKLNPNNFIRGNSLIQMFDIFGETCFNKNTL